MVKMNLGYGFIVAALQLVLSANAERDSNYYPSGMSNPMVSNENDKMYWRDASNVLQDLSKFDALYVRYHGCVWSPYEDEDEDDSCGVAEADSESYWYMGSTECFRANAAYTLYGTLSGEEDNGCSKASYINSFYTVSGIETFTQSLVNAGFKFRSSSSGGGNNNNNDDEAENDNGDNDEDEDYVAGVSSVCNYGEEDQNDDGNNNNGNYQHGQDIFPQGTMSYGLACENGDFVKKSFNGAYCSGHRAISVTDSLDDFNSDIQQARCVRIYSRNNNGDDDQDDGDAPIEVLYGSRACSIKDSTNGECPDPFGKLLWYRRALDRSTGSVMNVHAERFKQGLSWFFVIAGAILLLTAGVMYRSARLRKNSRPTKPKKKNIFQRIRGWFRRDKNRHPDDGSHDDGVKSVNSNASKKSWKSEKSNKTITSQSTKGSRK